MKTTPAWRCTEIHPVEKAATCAENLTHAAVLSQIHGVTGIQRVDR
ncbi:hypothetical protein [Streptomyces sirii]